jgi:hypothetical protein
MVSSDPTQPDSVTIEELLEAGEFDRARTALEDKPPEDAAYEVVRVKLGLYDGTLPPQQAMQRLIRLMQKDKDAPGAKELYQEASRRAYQSGQSSVAHSHPPPPARDRED